MAVSARASRHADSVRHSGRFSWWDSPICQEYYNLSICGKAASENGGGCREYLAAKLNGKALERAVSIGCGSGAKEIGLIEAGLVNRFDLWEIGPRVAEKGLAEAKRRGFGDRVFYHLGDAFAVEHEPYDLVYWDHSLHHMSDVVAAVRWSARAIRPGGFVMINDYVGPNRLQFSGSEISRANALLERHGFTERLKPSSTISCLRQWYRDPSEAPESERILSAIVLNLPDVELRVIGGALLNILGPIAVPQVRDDHPLLRDLLNQDAALKEEGVSHFVFAFWQRKPASTPVSAGEEVAEA